MRFTETAISKIKCRDNRYDIADDIVPSLNLRVEPTGVKTWYIYYRHPVTKQRIRKKIAPQEQLTVAQAREFAKNYVAIAIITKEDPGQVEKKQRERLTLKEVIKEYIPWLELHRKSVRQTIQMLKSFEPLYQVVAEEVSPADITKWKKTCAHLNPKTINRRVALLKGMYSWAAKEGHITQNPLKGNVAMLKEMDGNKIRYLTPEERRRLLSALEKRDEDKRDYLRAAVLLSLNTGIRKGTLTNLKWENIDWKRQILTLPSQHMKSGKTKRIPLNSIAFAALETWRRRCATQDFSGYLFSGNASGGRLGDIKTPWKNLLESAEITGFRWHDMRHDFASNLAMQGVDILTIKELMCHETLNMTLIYAHLAPQHIGEAVEKLSSLYK